MFIADRSALIIIIILSIAPLFANDVSAGFKTGVPVTDLVRTGGEIGGRPFQADTKHFTIGPVVRFELVPAFGIELGAMYKRFDQQAGQYDITVEPGVPYNVVGRPYSQTGQSWEFPIVGQYRFPGTAVRPYIEAGVSINRLDGVLTPFRLPAVSQSTTVQPQGHAESRVGVVVGLGVELKVPFCRITPGFRYTRYGAKDMWLVNADSVDFLIGFTF